MSPIRCSAAVWCFAMSDLIYVKIKVSDLITTLWKLGILLSAYVKAPISKGPLLIGALTWAAYERHKKFSEANWGTGANLLLDFVQLKLQIIQYSFFGNLLIVSLLVNTEFVNHIWDYKGYSNAQIFLRRAFPFLYGPEFVVGKSLNPCDPLSYRRAFGSNFDLRVNALCWMLKSASYAMHCRLLGTTKILV